MFAIGDKIVYPMHGAGVVESIEEKFVLGKTQKYYILKILHSSMQVMVPVESPETGLRAVMDKETIKDIINVLKAASTPMDSNWNRRNRSNMEKLKTGDIYQVAEVVRNLLRVSRLKNLSTGEKNLLQSARKILSSEIALVEGISQQEAEDYIDKAV